MGKNAKGSWKSTFGPVISRRLGSGNHAFMQAYGAQVGAQTSFSPRSLPIIFRTHFNCFIALAQSLRIWCQRQCASLGKQAFYQILRGTLTEIAYLLSIAMLKWETPSWHRWCRRWCDMTQGGSVMMPETLSGIELCPDDAESLCDDARNLLVMQRDAVMT